VPTSPGDDSTPFVSAATSCAATTASIYEEARERRSSTGLDGEGCAISIVDADYQDYTGLEARPPNFTGRSNSLAPYAERPARSQIRKGRSTFGSIAKE
jgi:hypothetical protein